MLAYPPLLHRYLDKFGAVQILRKTRCRRLVRSMGASSLYYSTTLAVSLLQDCPDGGYRRLSYGHVDELRAVQILRRTRGWRLSRPMEASCPPVTPVIAPDSLANSHTDRGNCNTITVLLDTVCAVQILKKTHRQGPHGLTDTAKTGALKRLRMFLWV